MHFTGRVPFAQHFKPIHAYKPDFAGGLRLLDTEPIQAWPGFLVIHDNRAKRMPQGVAESFKFLTYQLSTVGFWPSVALTGLGELGFDSGQQNSDSQLRCDTD